MDDPAIHAIKLFLLNRNFSAKKARENVHDGHWMLATLPLLCKVCCRDSYEAGIRHAVSLLEQGCHYEGEPAVHGASDWTPEDSVVVFQEAGIQT